jgi:hypothetical protein
LETWVSVAAELARETASYGNFKNEVMREMGPCKYERALHGIWSIMYRLQNESGRRDESEYEGGLDNDLFGGREKR